jgi:hypothetical protein
VDETYVKFAGQWQHAYRAVDQFGQVIDVFVTARRDTMAAAHWCVQRAIDTTKVGLWRSSPTEQRPIQWAKELLPAAWHRTEP